MKTASDVRKVLLFGFLGAVGCLMGWAIGEPFLRLAMPASDTIAAASLVSTPAPPVLDEAAAPKPPVAPPPIELAPVRTIAPPSPEAPKITTTVVAEAPPPPPDFQKRLEKAKAKSGDVQISLLWNNVCDLDLHCIDPRGEEIFYNHTESASGGQLDVDANGGGTLTTTPVENIFWPKGKAPKGKYQVFVNYYDSRGTTGPTKYKVNVLAGGKRKEYSGQLSEGNGKRHICDFEMGEAAAQPQLQVAASPEAVVYAGSSNRVSVRIARRPGDVKIMILPDAEVAGIRSAKITLQPSESEGQLELTADPNAAAGSRTFRIAATNGKDVATTEMKLTVRKMPAELRASRPPMTGIALEQGQVEQAADPCGPCQSLGTR